MGNLIIAIIVVLIVLVGMVLLFFFADWYGKDRKKVAKPQPVTQEKVEPVIVEVKETTPEIVVVPVKEKPLEKPETASERSRMYNRRARMSQYREKYKSRTMSFSNDSFDEPLDNSTIMVDGMTITRDDIRKLTALNGLLERKKLDDDAY